MADKGLDPEQIKRLNAAVQAFARAMRRININLERNRRLWRKALQRLQEERGHEIDQEVNGFASTLDNMTDEQIWREFQEDE